MIADDLKKDHDSIMFNIKSFLLYTKYILTDEININFHISNRVNECLFYNYHLKIIIKIKDN